MRIKFIIFLAFLTFCGCSEKPRTPSGPSVRVETQTHIVFNDGSDLVARKVGEALEDIRVVKKLPDGKEQRIEAKRRTVSDDVSVVRVALTNARIHQAGAQPTTVENLTIIFPRELGKK